MSYAGIRTYFNLESGDAVPVPTDISHWLDGVTPSSDTEELDGTTFQPGVAVPIKEIVAGFTTRNLSLSGKWTPEMETFCSAVEGKKDKAYEYGPLGNETGMTAIYGTCNVLSWTGPVSTVDGVVTAALELRCNTRLVGEFDATGAAGPVVLAAGAEGVGTTPPLGSTKTPGAPAPPVRGGATTPPRTAAPAAPIE